MESRHSVRQYLDKKIEDAKRELLAAAVKEVNEESGLRFSVYYDEKEGFDSSLADYGHFENVFNYIAIFGGKGKDEAAGYYGEKLVLKAQGIGLNTCWVVLTFNKGKVKKDCERGEKLYAVIALGYGKTQGTAHINRTEDVTKVSGEIPEGFETGVKAALLAPTAVNQQKFAIVCKDGKVKIEKKGLGFYTDLDLGIVKYHFEAASGIKVF